MEIRTGYIRSTELFFRTATTFILFNETYYKKYATSLLGKKINITFSLEHTAETKTVSPSSDSFNKNCLYREEELENQQLNKHMKNRYNFS